MYICLDCGKVFEDYIRIETDYGEKKSVSPCCCGAFAEAEQCEECEEWVEAEEVENGMCCKCQCKLEKRFNEILDKHFFYNEKEYILNNLL